MLVRCSMNCVGDSEKHVGQILVVVVSLETFTCTELCFRCDSYF
jgi:hypothetical protein